MDFNFTMPSASDITGWAKSAADVFNTVTQTKTSAQIARNESDFSLYSQKAGIDLNKAVLQGQLNRAQQQADASFQSGQAVFGNSGGGGGFAITPMVLLLIGGLAFLAFKK